MPGKQTQPKSGHLRGTSANKTNRTGRSSGHVQIQGGVPGHKYGKSGPVARPGGSDPKQSPSVRGYRDNVVRKRRDAGRIADGVGRPLPTPGR